MELVALMQRSEIKDRCDWQNLDFAALHQGYINTLTGSEYSHAVRFIARH